MADFVDITELTLGTTFGGWYARNNTMIQRLNALNVANIVGGDGITASPSTAANGGYTLSLSGSVTRDMVFNGNVTVNGTLISNFAGDISGTTIILPANTGVTLGNIVYIDNTGKVQKALADDECTAEVVGIVTGFTGDNAQIATTGKISGSSIISAFTGTPGATLQKGVVYFLSGGVSGAGTTLEPDVTSYVSKPMLLGLTGDSGLILPYRGFIATEGTVGNTTVIQGVCGGSVSGVLSVNGLTASLYLGTAIESNRKTTGHIHAVNNISYADFSTIGSLTKSLTISPETPSYPYTSSGVFQIPSIYTKSIKTEEALTSFTHITKHGPDNKIYLSTLGTADDVYKLHQIRITHINGLNTVRTNFVIHKFYNNVGASNWRDEFDRGETPVEGEFTQTYTEYRMKNVALISTNMDGNGIDANRNFLQFELFGGNNSTAPDIYTQSSYENALGLASTRWSNIVSTITPTTNIMTPVIRVPYGATLSASLGITASTAIGGLTSSGVYPTTYIKSDYNRSWNSDISIRNERHRVYGWKFNSVVLTGSLISGYINTTANAALFDVADTHGYTLDTSILGWNATTGPIPETVSIAFPSIDNYYANNNNPSQIGISTILEVYKYNPTTGVTGPIIMIPKDFRYFTTVSAVAGYNSTQIGQS